MKLLMITRKVDKNDVLAGFAYDWVKKIGEKAGNLKVICLDKGDVSGLPESIEIYSLGGEKGFGKLRKFWNFQKLALKLIPKIDGVFCHMNPEYTILIAPCAKLFRKKIVAWYTHKQVTWKLRLVNLLADKILTASPESCRLKNRKKIKVIGHGIDINKFQISNFKFQIDSKFNILSIGRISPVKDYETLIKAIEILVKKENKKLELQIIGGPGLKSQKEYFEKLKQIVREKNLEHCIKFLGPIFHNQILPYYQNCDLFINLSGTGSLDKAVLEAMACGCLVLTSNESFSSILPAEFLTEKNQPEKLAQKIQFIMNMPNQEKKEIGNKFREKVKKDHNLDLLVLKIVGEF